jgi:gamma-glutamyltranspeptidase/glutathione hydrolase
MAAGCGSDRAVEHPAYAAGQVVRSGEGVVVSGSPLATAVGVEILERGGNAVDAAVATAFALGVVEPTMSGIGGRTQMLIRTAAGDFLGIDGTTEVPATVPPIPLADEDAYGYGTIGIPGTVAALAAAHGSHGALSWAQVVAPAIALADTGFALPAEEAERIAALAGRLREFEGSARHFLKPDATPYSAGERFAQPTLARVLRAIGSDGPDVFYRGWIADSIAADMARLGGLVTQQDLERYAAQRSTVVRGSYRRFELVGTYLPASGATTIEALHILEQFDLDDRAGSAEWLALVAQALLLSFTDRTADLGTPDEHARTLVSKDWAAQRAAAVTDPGAVRVPAVADLAVGTTAAWRESDHTTHLSVADGKGGFVALTQSLGPTLGSKVASANLGFLYAATMGYLGALAPGDRPFSSQSPLMILDEGSPVFVLGAAGGRRIISAVVAVVSRLIDQRLPLADAMAAPRLHPTTDTIYVEVRDGTAWTETDIADLRSFGFGVAPRSSASYFARLHAVAFEPGRTRYTGVADSRWNGGAGAPRRR